jgi:predicted Zn-dependent protease
MTLLGERELQRMAREVLGAVEADQAEVLFYGGTSALTRFANNYIHQNVEDSSTTVRVRAVIGKKIGVAGTDNVTPEGLQAVARRAVDLAKLQQDNETFTSLPGPTPVPTVNARLPQTAECSAERRAEVVAAICSAATRAGLTAAGAFRTAESETAVYNTLGIAAYHAGAQADVNTVIMGEATGGAPAAPSGHAERWTLDVDEIDGDAIAAEAIDKAQRSLNAHHLEPGEYDVVLEEYAVSDLMDYFSYLSFSGQAVLEQRSFMAGRIGEKVMGENVSIWDDGASILTLPSPFDAEGVARQRVDFVQNGIARGVAWDTYTAAQAGTTSTGHALPAGETFGPIPGNMFMATGDATKDDMLASTQRGIWVSRFWYTRPVHPMTVMMTGMTRDGTFLIENGKLVAPVHNLRFTQSYLEAMNRVEMIGREARLLSGFGAVCTVPALKIRGWHFTGATES